jgi:hypothetical protein
MGNITHASNVVYVVGGGVGWGLGGGLESTTWLTTRTLLTTGHAVTLGVDGAKGTHGHVVSGGLVRGSRSPGGKNASLQCGES